MALTKRQQKQSERRLVLALTQACEVAKTEISGFSWLTHDTGGQPFPAGLRVTWVFDTQASLDQALADGQERRIQELTCEAHRKAEITLSAKAMTVRFDTEEACQRSHSGNWALRLAQSHRSKH